MRSAPATLFPHTDLLLNGFQRLESHLTQRRPDDNGRRLLAARAAVLVIYLQTNRSFDFGTVRYTGSAAQLTALKTATLNGHPHSWIDSLKAVNPEAYYYWHLALSS